MSDMEGVAGVVKWSQVTGGDSAAYQQARELYTGEINAAVRGAKAAGADEIIVMDCHGAGNGWSRRPDSARRRLLAMARAGERRLPGPVASNPCDPRFSFASGTGPTTRQSHPGRARSRAEFQPSSGRRERLPTA